jgi:hypothetical protein
MLCMDTGVRDAANEHDFRRRRYTSNSSYCLYPIVKKRSIIRYWSIVNFGNLVHQPTSGVVSVLYMDIGVRRQRLTLPKFLKHLEQLKLSLSDHEVAMYHLLIANIQLQESRAASFGSHEHAVYGFTCTKRCQRR